MADVFVSSLPPFVPGSAALSDTAFPVNRGNQSYHHLLSDYVVHHSAGATEVINPLVNIRFAGSSTANRTMAGSVSVARIGTATTYDIATGNIVDAPANTERFGLTSSGEPALLREAISTNFLTNSAGLSGWTATTGSSVAAIVSGTPAPSGTIDGISATFNASTAGSVISPGTTAVADQLTFSIWIRSALAINIALSISTPTDGKQSSIAIAVGSTWTRHHFTATVTDSAVTASIDNSIDGLAGTIDLWGGQLEQSSSPTSLIKTIAGPIARDADVVRIPFNGNFTTMPNWAVVMEIERFAVGGAPNDDWAAFQLENSFSPLRTSDSIGSLQRYTVDGIIPISRSVVGALDHVKIRQLNNSISVDDGSRSIITAQSFGTRTSYDGFGSTNILLGGTATLGMNCLITSFIVYDVALSDYQLGTL